MKDIGKKLKDKREENGVSVEEAAEDLKMRPSQITSVENGDADAFKDKVLLKYFIRDYAKYLGLDPEKLVDEFNEFLFDLTSKIPIEAIEQAKKDKEKEEPMAKVSSPYTTIDNRKKIPKYVIALVALIVVIILAYIIVSNIRGNDFNSDNITYAIRR